MSPAGRAAHHVSELGKRRTVGERLRDPATELLASFLVERYAFFVKVAGEVRMARVYRHPWILKEAIVRSCRSTMIKALGIGEPTGPTLTHFSRSLNVEAWEPRVP